jgi:hypothetical protein
MSTYTESQLTAHLTTEVYSQHPYDLAEFIAARVSYVSKPTSAVIITTVPYDPRQSSTASIGPNTLSTAEQALKYHSYLVSLGMNPKVPIRHNFSESSVQTIQWNGETRRLWAIGPYQVGELMLQYAKNPSFDVDLHLQEDMRTNGLLTR